MRCRPTIAIVTGHSLTEADPPILGESNHEKRDIDPPENEALSDSELGDLVTGACFFAVEAMDQPCPETAVDLAAHRERALLLEKLEALPKLQFMHPLVQAETSQRIALIREQRELAKAILRSALSYGSGKARCYQLALN